MHVLHSIFKKSRGGAERAFIDYCRMSLDQGHQVRAIVHPKCQMIGDLEDLGIPYKTIRFIGGWDPLSKFKAKRALKTFNPDLIVCHGSRPAQLLHGIMPSVPLVGVGHVYKNVDYFAQKNIPVITLTKDMEAYAASKGISESHIFRLSNVVYLKAFTPHDYTVRTPFKIGSMGRFAYSKGFDVLIDALGILHGQGYIFQCDIAGTGHRKSELIRQIDSLGMTGKVILHDWIDDVGTFLEDLDLFCFPSRHEPFGLALLEALARGLPIVTSNAEGPSEIITPDHDGLMCEKGDPVSLAVKIKELITDSVKAENLGVEARKTFEKKFHPVIISQELNQIFQSLFSSKTEQ